MASLKTLYAIVILSALLAACTASYPLNLSQEEWSRLSPEQQLEARTRQAEIDAVSRRAREVQHAEEEARRKAEEHAYQERIKQRYRQAEYGDIVQCILEQGVMDFKPGWHDIEPVGFMLVRGEQRQINAHASGTSKQISLWVKFDEDAMTISVCRNPPRQDTYKTKECRSIAATTRQFRKGIKKSFQHNDMRATLYCNLRHNW